MTRHEFLKALHELLQPKVYLEIGVQHGWSLELSNAPITIGIDPEPLVSIPNAKIHKVRSDYYFADDDLYDQDAGDHLIDLAFIDGMHLAEYALRDFINIERRSHQRTVVVLDDVLPTTREMAAREMCSGDWTGDVWRVYDMLRSNRPDLTLTLVDTQPTGVLVVMNLNSDVDTHLHNYDFMAHVEEPVRDWVLDRRHALSPSTALAEITRRMEKITCV